MSRKNLESSTCSFDSNPSTSNDSPILGPNKYDKMNYLLLLKENRNDPKYKTELCKKFMERGTCPYGQKCRFAHGKEELLEKKIDCKLYKQKKCNSFYNNKYCNYGSRCHFQHDQRSLEEIKVSYYVSLLNYLSLGLNEDIVIRMNVNELQNEFVNMTPSSILKQHSRFM